jgi:hypothetical protein
LVSFTGKELPIPIGEEAVWATQPVESYGEEKYLIPTKTPTQAFHPTAHNYTN